MVTWTQMYMPMGGLGLSALVALIPIIFFFVALAVLRLKGHVAGAITLILSILIAIFAFKMPIDMAFAAAGYGFIYGLWPIAWIIVAAVFLYKFNRCQRSVRYYPQLGYLHHRRSAFAGVTDWFLLWCVAGRSGWLWCAGGDYRCAAGGPGLQTVIRGGAVSDCQHCASGVWCVGRADSGRGQVTGIDPFHIGAMAGRQLPFLSVLVPFWLVAMMDGWKGVKETWPAALVAGGSFAVTQFFTSNYIGPELPDITSALVSIVSLALFLKVWRPKNTETAISMGQSAGAMVVNKPSSGGPVPSEYSLGSNHSCVVTVFNLNGAGHHLDHEAV